MKIFNIFKTSVLYGMIIANLSNVSAQSATKFTTTAGNIWKESNYQQIPKSLLQLQLMGMSKVYPFVPGEQHSTSLIGLRC